MPARSSGRPVRRPAACAIAGCALLLGLTAPPPACADVVTFTSGRSKEVIVLEETDDAVKVESSTGIVTIPRSTITAINKVSPEENQALRREWLEAERRKERARAEAARRLAEQRAREARQERNTVVVDGERVSRIEAARRAERQAAQRAANSIRVDAYRRELGEEAESADPLVVTDLAMNVDQPGVAIVTGSIMNLSAKVYRDVSVDVQLVSKSGEEDEQVVTDYPVFVSELAPNDLHDFRVEMPVNAPEDLRLRAVIQDARAADGT